MTDIALSLPADKQEKRMFGNYFKYMYKNYALYQKTIKSKLNILMFMWSFKMKIGSGVITISYFCGYSSGYWLNWI